MGGPGSGPRPGKGRHASLNKTGTPGTRAERNRGQFRRGARVPENIKKGEGRKKSVRIIKQMDHITRRLNREAASYTTRAMKSSMRKK